MKINNYLNFKKIKDFLLRNKFLVGIAIIFLGIVLFSVANNNSNTQTLVNQENLSYPVVDPNILEKNVLNNYKTEEFVPASNDLGYVSSVKVPVEFSENEYSRLAPSMVKIKYSSMSVPTTQNVVNALKTAQKGNDIEFTVTGDGVQNLTLYINYLNSTLGDSMAKFSLKQVEKVELNTSGTEFSQPLPNQPYNTIQTIYLLYFNNAPVGRVDSDLYIVRTTYTDRSNSTILLPNFFPTEVSATLVEAPKNQLANTAPIIYDGYGAFDATLRNNVQYSTENFEVKTESAFISYLINTNDQTLYPIVSKRAIYKGTSMSEINDYFIMGVVE
jgi:hypothetical protein